MNISGRDIFSGPREATETDLEADEITSLILYGPSGAGRTALARMIAEKTEADSGRLNAAAMLLQMTIF